MDLHKLHDAARTLGISYPTLKQWIYNKKINSVKTAGGHHRIPQREIDRLTEKEKRGLLRSSKTRGGSGGKKSEPTSLEAISGRNKLSGVVSEIRYDGLLAQVVIDVGVNQQMVSIITADSARSLDLKKGANVFALVKATEVMVIRGG